MTTGPYDRIYEGWARDPEAFWAGAAEAIGWERRWDRVVEQPSPHLYRWFPGARLNTCWNALDRHVDGGRADQLALIYDSTVTGTVRTYTYRDLRDRVAKVAGMLAALGDEHKGQPPVTEPPVAVVGSTHGRTEHRCHRRALGSVGDT
jgi:propionyl-CoA synthetase